MAKEDTLITAKVFLEDAVYLKDQPERLGLVVKTWHDFDSGESDTEDEDSLELQKVTVHWADGAAPQTVHEDDLVVADRSFSHGDVVKRSPNDIMSGTVIGVKVELDLEKVCPPMTRFSGIDATHVDFVQQFVVHNHIIYDGWLGVIEEVKDEVTVLFSDNSVCVIKDSDDLDLWDQIHDQSCFFPDRLAPGHAVCGPSRVFKNAEFLIGTYASQKHGYVLRTEIVSITVDWLSFNPLALDQTPGVAPPPRVLDDFENVIVYKSVEQHCTYELQDRVKITDPETLRALGLKEYCPYLSSKPRRLQCPDKTHNHAAKFATEEMKVVGTKTRVIVQWQDLSITEDEPSTSLIPYLNIDDQDVWPSDYVLLKTGEVMVDQPGGVNFDRKKSDMLGIIQSVNAKERTALIKWFSEERDQGLEQEAEEFSLYEIMSHPDLKFTMGNMVVVSREREQSPSSDIAPRAPSVDDILLLVGRGNEIFNELVQERSRRRMLSSTEANDPRAIERRGSVLLDRYGVEGVEALDRYLSETNKMAAKTVYWLVDRGNPLKPPVPSDILSSLPEHEKDLETIRPRLNWVGQIWKVYQDRPAALIRFMDGTSEEIPVGRIMVVDDEDDDDEDEEEDADDEEFEEYDFDHDSTEEVSSDDSWETDSEAENESVEDTEDQKAPKETEDKEDLAHAKVGASPETIEPVDPKTTVGDQESISEPEIQDPLPEPEDIASIGQNSPANLARSAQEHRDWKSFAVLDATPADHHFLNHRHDIQQSDRAWIKRIAKEHAILSSSLPDGIRVRAFEDRMDLLRVLIQGPDHTPYRNALFLFDFKLTSHFPSQPPVAFFHSWTGGIGRINPNLYEDGNVCLSLLNTWHGKDQTETWTPSSSILQLLISLQGLVLVPNPYYNEAGFEKFVGTQEAARNSELYNEKVYLLSLKTIQTILNNPPSPFQKEVRHFYFDEQKLEHTVIEGLELIARSEAAAETENMDSNKNQNNTSNSIINTTPDNDPTFEAEPGLVIKRISKGALKMLKKHIDTLSLSLEE
ncbi:hypothetical protein BC939DRAFT_456985 [Gamsiella multidivaricata]|uniref:uncharacterized protein n=1 Tax=Gamsiella multidivaricata TaxID=101098 RepID=UPI0022208497|nr:uncharacterized protein BC939DRAFT_456985 [Gamsiella multidivaricata]KAG0371329.1 hypothetical protein BGZ54_006618 [Gamsiella multidivaricata]KAI7820801.1 hypothetical protein BC939DRAFT_456985 [Gamsiella multidivaricata]